MKELITKMEAIGYIYSPQPGKPAPHMMFMKGYTPEGFKGSKVYYLQGGKSKEEAGVIFQKDENPIRIENYAGNMKLIYAHENAGTKVEDYKAGDTHIGSAAEGSRITVVTDNKFGTLTSNGNILEI